MDGTVARQAVRVACKLWRAVATLLGACYALLPITVAVTRYIVKCKSPVMMLQGQEEATAHCSRRLFGGFGMRSK